MNRWRCGVAMMLGLATMPAWAAMKTQPVEWKHQGTTFSGVLVYDDGGHDKRPGLVMVPNWKGVNESAIERPSSWPVMTTWCWWPMSMAGRAVEE